MANKAVKFVNRVVAELEDDMDPVYNAIIAVEKKFGYDRWTAYAEETFEMPPEYKRAINGISSKPVYYHV